MSGPGGLPADPARLLEVLQVDLPPDQLSQSLTHRSYAYEKGGLPTNERLEFLGDAVLGLVVTAALDRRHEKLPEGQLAKLRAAVVNMRALAGVARGLRLGDHILLGRGEEGSGGRDKDSILADTVEALIGAVYLEHGIQVAGELVHRLVDQLLDSSAELGAGLDWKTSLQELTAGSSRGVPEYTVDQEGPDHAKLFHAVVRVQGRPYGQGSGRSKKEAEQAAAAAAFERLEEERATDEAGADPASNPDLNSNPDSGSNPDLNSNPDSGSGPDLNSNPDSGSNPDLNSNPDSSSGQASEPGATQSGDPAPSPD